MSRDIETLGFPLESFDEVQQEYLMKFADTDEKREEAIQKLNHQPVTARVIAIGMLNPDSGAGTVFYQSESNDQSKSGAVICSNS